MSAEPSRAPSFGVDEIRSLGVPSRASPLHLTRTRQRTAPSFTSDDARVRRDVELPEPASAGPAASFERAGPRDRIFFDPSETTVGIVAAGGLCPGINDVVRSAVMELRHGYGVPRILGFRYGLAGLDPQLGHPPMALTLDAVRDIHTRSGSVLGSSRGPRDPDAMIETLQKHRVDILLTIGGDGTMRAAHALQEAIARRGLQISVVGIPKTIDNDIPFVDKTFGFDSAVATARAAIDAAHAEARSVENGVGLVKLMGRNAGFIAANATLASRDVNACIVPEVPFELGALLQWLEQRLVARGHAVIVVAEGAAQLLAETRGPQLDSSGNRSYGSAGADIGRYLRERILAHFEARKPITLKYIDPSYMLRGTRASSEDAVFCDALARNAVHAAMAGKTDMMVGRWHRCFTHVALRLVLTERKSIDPAGDLWRTVVESTGQPAF